MTDAPMDGGTDGGTDERWIDVAAVADLTAKRKLVVDVDGTAVLVLWHDERPFAFQNLCIHRDRELSKGVILNGKLVCPGHQWAFVLDSGWEAVKQQCQPTFAVRVRDDRVELLPRPVVVDLIAGDDAASV